MPSSADPNPEQEIRKLLRGINEAWVKGHPEDLAGYFHPNMVIVPPDFQGRLEGREACAESYRDFRRQATIRDFRECDPAIDVCGNTAVASYPWEIHYEMNGQNLHESGRDLFVFTREGNRWQAVWRTIILPPLAP